MWRRGHNLFKDASDPRGCGLSKLGYQFLAGVLRHLPAICAVVSPTVNSYKRLIKQGSMSGLTWAPVFVCYGNNNRTNTLRIPLGRRTRRAARGRQLLQSLSRGGNGAAAGLEGIREDLDPGEPHTENMYRKTEAELKELGMTQLPDARRGVDAFEADPLSAQVMGGSMFAAYARFRRDEWDAYHNAVSDWERNRYLKFF